jgi:hypothetical protein
MLISMPLHRRGSGSIQIFFHRRQYAILGCWARLGVVPCSESVCCDGTRHDDDRSHLGLIQLDLSTKRLENYDGTDQPFSVELGDQTSLRHDVPISKIGGKICEAIENVLKEAVAIPINERHRTNALGPLCPIGIVDKGKELHQNLMKDGLGFVTGANSGNHHAHVDA